MPTDQAGRSGTRLRSAWIKANRAQVQLLHLISSANISALRWHSYKKYRPMRYLLLLLGFISIPASSFGQSANLPTQISVSHSGDDMVGSTLAYELREKIKSSNQMELARSDKLANGIVVSLVTIDPEEESNVGATQTAYSATWNYLIVRRDGTAQFHLSSSVGICGADRVISCAQSLAASTDKQRRQVPSLKENLPLIIGLED